MTGHIIPNVLPDDEADISAELEGVEEADQDRRRAAKDEDPPDRIRLPHNLAVGVSVAVYAKHSSVRTHSDT